MDASVWERAFGPDVPLSLLAADTDRVKEYVFESARLHEVRGASAQLSALNEVDLPALVQGQFSLPPASILFAGGGSALLVVPTDVAGPLASAIQHRYLQVTGVATISVVHHPLAPGQLEHGLPPRHPGFGGLVAWLGYRLRLAKESRPVLPFLSIPAYVQACTSCQRRPATQEVPDPDGETRLLCEVCRRKADLGRGEKPRYLQAFEAFLRSSAADTPYARALQARPGTPETAPSLEEIGQASAGRARGYVGLIYADGNGVGQWLEACRTPEEFASRSQDLRRASEHAVFGALARWLQPWEGRCSDRMVRWLHPVEIVAIGGDDVFLVVPGDVALDVAATTCQRFGDLFGGALTMSAAVLVMPQRFPIYYGREVCEALLKHAKAAGRRGQSGQAPPAMIDFQVVSGDTSLTSDLEAYRRQAYRLHGDFREVLTERPYQIARLQALLQLARWMRSSRFPSSQLYQLRRAVAEGGWIRSGNWHRYQLVRAQGEGSPYREFHERLSRGLELDGAHAPWRWSEGRFSTPVADLAEMLDYVRPE
ncbi:MAG: hypothetical protein HY690_18810 [Chloroflexi bacterium]|nr:hypothetical protein [Chloroflexota bacterium]